MTTEKPLGADIDLLVPMRKMKAADVLLAACEEAHFVMTHSEQPAVVVSVEQRTRCIAQLRTAIDIAQKGEA